MPFVMVSSSNAEVVCRASEVDFVSSVFHLIGDLLSDLRTGGVEYGFLTGDREAFVSECIAELNGGLSEHFLFFDSYVGSEDKIVDVLSAGELLGSVFLMEPLEHREKVEFSKLLGSATPRYNGAGGVNGVG